MKGLKKMLLGFAFLLIALMGAIMYEYGDFAGFFVFIGLPIGLIYCIIGCYDEKLSNYFNKHIDSENNGEEDKK